MNPLTTVPTGYPAFSTVTSIDAVDTIDPLSRNIHLTIPLFEKKGRGNSNLSFNVEYDSSIWTLDSYYSASHTEPTAGKVIPAMPDWGWRVGAVGMVGSLHYAGYTGNSNVSTSCTSGQHVAAAWYYIDSKGSRHNLGDSVNNYDGVASPACGMYPAQATLTAGDNSGYVLQLTNIAPYVVALYDRSGNRITAPLCNDWDSTVGHVVPYHAISGSGSITDPNGNSLSVTDSAVVDTTGTTVIQIGPKQSVGGVTEQTFSYTAPDGSQSTTTMTYGAFTVASSFATSSTDFINYPATSAQLPVKITLPDGTFYAFEYEANTQYPQYVTGRISKLTLPLGGAIQYQYGISAPTINYDMTAATLTRTSPDGSWLYGAPSTTIADLNTITEQARSVFDPEGNETVYISPFLINIAAQQRVYSGHYLSNATPLARTTYCWAKNTTSGPCTSRNVWGPQIVCKYLPPGLSDGCLPWLNNPQVPAAVTETKELNGVVQSQTYTLYNSAELPTEVREYGSSSNLLRSRTIQYASLANNILDRPSSITIADGNGNTQQLTSIGYDSRGNTTSVTKSGPSTTAVMQSFTYTSTGLLNTATDANGNQTSYTYGECNNSYPSTIMLPLNHTLTMHWDCDGGLPLYSQDENTQKTSFSYDPMWRLTETDYPDGGAKTARYNFSATTPNVQYTQKLDSSSSIATQTNLDGLGRPVQQVLLSDPVGRTYTDTTYDSLGRVASISTPYRFIGDSTHGLTTFSYDALSRKRYQCQPDNGSSNPAVCTPNRSYLEWAYNVNVVDAYDEARNHWQRTTDPLGRLVKVLEPSGSNPSAAPNLETDYSYDVLNNLLSVEQWGGPSGTSGAITRSFTYDSLSRLITSTNPETGTICYGLMSGGQLGGGNPGGSGTLGGACQSGYDANGNLLYKTDARGVTTTYSYDALNRLTSKSYSDGTQGVQLFYDQPAMWGLEPLSNTIGRLSRSYAGTSDQQYSYDAMGRIISVLEALPSEMGVSEHHTHIGYDLAGNITDLTYPNNPYQMGPHIKQTWDGAGRLSSSSLVDIGGVPASQSYLQSASYLPDGSPNVLTLGNGVQQTIAKNNRLQVQSMAVSTPLPPFANQMFLSHSYCYVNCFSGGTGNNGNIWEIADTLNSNNTQDFTYDSLNRIADFSLGRQQHYERYEIDAFGNMSEDLRATYAPVFGANNRITNLPCAAYVPQAYDAAGNQLCDLDQNGLPDIYTYDAESRISGVSLVSGVGPFATYNYGADGSRVRKTTTGAGAYTEYAYLAGQPMGEKDQSGAWTYYIYANGQKIAKVAPQKSVLHLSGYRDGNNWMCGGEGAIAGSPSYPSGPIDYTIGPNDKFVVDFKQNQASNGGAAIIFHDANGTLVGAGDLTDIQTGTPLWWNTTTDVWQHLVADLHNYVGLTVSYGYAGFHQSMTGGNFDMWYANMAIITADGQTLPFTTGQGQTVPNISGTNCSGTNMANGTVSLATTGQDAAEGTTYYLADHLGTAQMEFVSGGWPIWEGQFAPYGGEIDTQTTSMHYKFTGKERDQESGLDYFGARYYASTMGRWMSPDWNETPVPIPYGNLGDPQTLNLYAYVGNNPLSRTDPTGHAGQDQKLTSQSTIRVDAASADQVNVHVKTNSGEFRGRLNPDTKQIDWTKGAPPKQYAEAAQAYVLSKGKYDIAAAKQEMSVLGGTREGEGAGAGKLGEATNLAFALMQIVEIGTQAYSMSKINALEGTTGFHVQIDGSLAVTNLQKFGDTFGAGAGVKLNGDTFKLNGSGQWVDRHGSTLTQDKNGWHVTTPTV